MRGFMDFYKKTNKLCFYKIIKKHNKLTIIVCFNSSSKQQYRYIDLKKYATKKEIKFAVMVLYLELLVIF